MNIYKLYLLSVPLFSVGMFVSGKFISLSIALALVIAILALLSNKLRRDDFSWASPFFWFLGSVIIGLVLSPYGLMPWKKGGVQIAGLLVMIFVAAYILRYIKSNPLRLYSLLRLYLSLLGWVSIIGLIQFIVCTLTLFELSFGFLNTIAGGGSGVDANVWRDSGFMGPFKRVNSIAAEPSILGTYLSLGLGIALIRLGVLGRTYRNHVSSLLSYPVAAAITVCMVLSLSMNCWLMLTVVIFMLYFLSKNISVKALIQIVTVVAFVVWCLYQIALLTGETFADKIDSLALISLGTEVDDIKTEQVSAVAVASNLEVTYQNFTLHPVLGGGVGSHPIAYKIFLPAYLANSENEGVIGLNKDDASTLIFRLLSETGVVGICLFVLGLGAVVSNARKAILSSMGAPMLAFHRTVAIGITAGTVGIMETYLTRLGRYYDPIFWLAIAFTMAATYCLLMEMQKSRMDMKVQDKSKVDVGRGVG